jgi:hypothetical protein
MNTPQILVAGTIVFFIGGFTSYEVGIHKNDALSQSTRLTPLSPITQPYKIPSILSPTMPYTIPSSWKTSVDPQYHFSFSYPSTWIYNGSSNDTQYQQNLPDFLNQSYDTFFTIKNTYNSAGPPLSFRIAMHQNIEKWSLEQWINQLNLGRSVVRQEDVLFAGGKAIKMTFPPTFETIYGNYISPDQTTNILFELDLGGNGESGSNYPDDDPFILQERENFSLLFSTFRFVPK